MKKPYNNAEIDEECGKLIPALELSSK